MYTNCSYDYQLLSWTMDYGICAIEIQNTYKTNYFKLTTLLYLQIHAPTNIDNN